MTKAIIFDFDGTLVDSEKTIYRCFQNATKKIAPNRINYAKNILIGPPLRDTASSILGPNHQDKLDEFVKLFIEKHDDQIIFQTQPYDGVHKHLEKLSLMNIPMAIATNKRHAPTMKLIKHYGWEDHFCIVECSDTNKKVRDKNMMIQEIINKNNIYQGGFFLGDTVSDGLSANYNKLDFIKADYGYGKNQDWSNINIIKTINSILDLNINWFKKII